MEESGSRDTKDEIQRVSGWRLRSGAFFLLLLALLLLLVLRKQAGSYAGIGAWAAACLAYILLQVVRRWSARHYDSRALRWFRILANLALITWLLSISQEAAIVLWPLYLIPIMSCTTLLSDWRATAFTFVAAALAFWSVAYWWPAIPLMSVLQGIVVLVVMAVITLQMSRPVHVA